MRRVVAVVQARAGSTRLPGKVLAEIEGVPMLELVLRRVLPAETVSAVAVATSTAAEDDPVAELAGRAGVTVVRGSALDVLDRYVQAARELEADAVVRLTADNPFVDANVVDLVTRTHEAAMPRPDYTSTTLGTTFPYGIAVEAVESASLETAGRDATDPYEREHVTPQLYRNPDRFRLLAVESPVDYDAVRLTVDDAGDLAFARRVFAHLGGTDASWRDAADAARAHPEWRARD
jgi:spore coat polysaccharide biosynthesis protein SpsF (cytidylyltransferase family)